MGIWSKRVEEQPEAAASSAAATEAKIAAWKRAAEPAGRASDQTDQDQR